MIMIIIIIIIITVELPLRQTTFKWPPSIE